MATGARVIIVTGCIKTLISRVSEAFIERNDSRFTNTVVDEEGRLDNVYYIDIGMN